MSASLPPSPTRSLYFAKLQKGVIKQEKRKIFKMRLCIWPFIIGLLAVDVAAVLNSINDTYFTASEHFRVLAFVLGVSAIFLALLLFVGHDVIGKEKVVLRTMQDPSKQLDLERLIFDHTKPVWMDKPHEYVGAHWAQWVREGSAREAA